MANFFVGYSCGYEAAKKEARKEAYEKELKSTIEAYEESSGEKWSDQNQSGFDHQWRLQHIKPPVKITEHPPSDWLIVGLSLFFFVLCLIAIIHNHINKTGVYPFLLTFATGLLPGFFIFGLVRSHRTHQTIARIGEDAWREQEALRQAENCIKPWNASEE